MLKATLFTTDKKWKQLSGPSSEDKQNKTYPSDSVIQVQKGVKYGDSYNMDEPLRRPP